MNLSTFCKNRRISLRQLAEIAGGANAGASKSQIGRFLKGELDKDYTAKLRIQIAEGLPNFLLLQGMSPFEINEELQQIFNEQEYKPMITKRIELPADAQKWFALREDPFSINLRGPQDVFISDELQQIFDRVIDAIKYQGFVAVTGPIGAGKTVLRAWIEDYISQNSHLKLIFPETFDMAKVSPASISRAILEDFDYGKIPIDAVSRAKAVKRLLAEKKDVSVAIAFDECHRLNPTTLASLKNFLEMNSGGFRRYLGVLLFGQPSFEAQLTKSREIAERLTVLEMPKFEKSAVEYLRHRLQLAGGDLDQLFDADALEIIANNSRTPLQLGNICNQAMINAMRPPYESRKVLGGIIRASMHFANLTKSKSALKAVR